MKIHLSHLDGPVKKPDAPAAAPWIALALLAVAVLAFYGRALHRGFTSEDFLLLRVLRADPPWHHLGAFFSSPWLGLQLFQFYRPVSTLLFALEVALFGNAPYAYALAHTLVHIGNAFLVYAIARRLTLHDAGRPGTGSALLAALLFALHPLHPNAVVFAASFATLFATTFLLGAFLCHQVAGEDPPPAGLWRGGSLVLLALALGSYEAAAILPFLWVAYDLLVDRREVSLLRRLLAWLPAFLLLGLYFALRLALFGTALGGYEETRQRLLSPRLEELVHSVYQIFIPLFDRPLGSPASWRPLLLLTVVGLLPLLWLSLTAARRPALRLWLFSWVWLIAALLPFAFRPVVPGSGRNVYLAVVGAVLGLAVLARSLAVALSGVLGGALRSAPLFGLVAVGVTWSLLLAGHLGAYVEAGTLARSIAGQLELVVAAPTPKGPSPVFVSGVPSFILNSGHGGGGGGAPLAQVFHYGLSDAVAPPFGRGGAAVYPLPPLQVEELMPLVLGRPNARVCEWEPSAGKLRQVSLYPTPSSAELAVISPPDGARLAPGELAVILQPGAATGLRLLVLARGNPVEVRPAPEAVPGGAVRLALPRDFLVAMDGLYGGDFYWWVEGRDGAGKLLWSRMRAFQLARSPGRS